MWWIVLSLIVVGILYWKFIKPLNYWKNLGIPYSKPWPIVGNLLPVVLRQKNFLDIIEDMYMEFPTRYNGVHQFTKPMLLIRDLDLIKQITVKDFDHFTDHNPIIPEDVDPLLGKNLASLKGQRWRDMRGTLSPAFTSSKMRLMFTLMSEAAEQFTQHFQKKGTATIILEMKDAFTRYTNDVIATTAFGLKCDSLEERENEFYLMGKIATDFGGVQALKFFAYGMFPSLMKFLNIPFFKVQVGVFFRRLVKESIEYREREGLIRPDMLNLLIQARKGKLKYEESDHTDTGFATVEESDIGKTAKQSQIEWTDDELTAQALIFFFGGFETSSTLLCFVAYELAINPHVQARLQAEIDETLEKCNGKVTYEVIIAMKYLDMVLSETLRMWPPGFSLDRVCVKDYIIPAATAEENDFLVKKNTVMFVPVIGLHRDPKYFPNPKKFDPERFSDENKGNIVPQSYIPFGVGPRNCIGSRFALLENKILICHLLSKFDLVPVEKTPIPMKLSKIRLNLQPDDGFWLGLKQRKNKLM